MKTVYLSLLLSALAVASPVQVSHLTRGWEPWGHPGRPGQPGQPGQQLHTTSLTHPHGAHYFFANVTIGTQSFNMVLDLGSSDIFVPVTGFTCEAEPCGYQATFNIDDTFTQITDENFSASYGAGPVLGITGYDSVSIAGVTVPKQQIGLPDIVANQQFGQASGIFGLAFPAITSAFSGTNASLDNSNNHVVYSSVINTIFEVDNLTAPLLSLALSRDASQAGYGGMFALGGILPLREPQVNASTDFAVVPIELDYMLSTPPTVYGHYVINVTGVEWTNGSTGGSNFSLPKTIVDSGAPGINLPTHIANAINALFDPPQRADGSLDCSAKAPEVTMIIDGKNFPLSPSDLVVPYIMNTTAKADSGYNITCMSAIEATGAGSGGVFLLGEPFLKNALAVADWGTKEMRFASREYYLS